MTLYKKELIDKNALRFDKKYKYNEDGGFAVEAFMYAQSVLFLDRPVYSYRHNFVGVMNSYKKKAFFSLDEVNLLLLDYFKREGCDKEKRTFIVRKRVQNLIDSVNTEIIHGTKDGFYKLIEEILENSTVVKMIEGSIKNHYLSETEEDYLKAMIDKRFQVIWETAKMKALEKVYKRLTKIEVSNNDIVEKLHEKGIKNVAIYGAGEVGRIIAAEMKKESVSVEVFMDVSMAGFINDTNVCVHPNEYLSNKIDGIINTVLVWKSEIKIFLENKFEVPIISVWELLS